MPRLMVRLFSNDADEYFAIVDVDRALKQKWFALREAAEALANQRPSFCNLCFWEADGVLLALVEEFLDELGDLNSDAYADIQDNGWAIVPSDFPKKTLEASDLLRVDCLRLEVSTTALGWVGWSGDRHLHSDVIPFESLECPVHGTDDDKEATCLECLTR